MIDRIKDQFIAKGYEESLNYKLPKSMLWQPDLILTKNNNVFLVLFKTNNSIPPSFLNRILIIPKDNIIPLIIFAQKLNSKEEKDILSLGISVGYFLKGRLVNIIIKKKLPRNIAKKDIENKLPSIHIFISSKQDIDEREFVKGRIYYLRDTFYYPFFPHLIEYNNFPLSKLYKHIDEEMKKCEWIIILLEDNYSKVVKYEINKSIKMINHKNIFMFRKSTQKCKKAWEKITNKIEKLENKSIHYLPFSDTNDLEITLSRAIKSRIDEICKKKKIKLFN
jgi:hypothetical protein